MVDNTPLFPLICPRTVLILCEGGRQYNKKMQKIRERSHITSAVDGEGSVEILTKVDVRILPMHEKS